MSYYGFRPYVPVAKRRAQAAKKAAQFAKAGRTLSPVAIEGRTIAKTFWGKAWCQHLEAFSDYENRLPRGRTYARNGSILDLQIAKGIISALVMGSDLYQIRFTIAPLHDARWMAIKSQSTGQIDSLVELLQGRFSDAVMRVITDRATGLFPAPSEIKKSCSCPANIWPQRSTASGRAWMNSPSSSSFSEESITSNCLRPPRLELIPQPPPPSTPPTSPMSSVSKLRRRQKRSLPKALAGFPLRQQ